MRNLITDPGSQELSETYSYAPPAVSVRNHLVGMKSTNKHPGRPDKLSFSMECRSTKMCHNALQALSFIDAQRKAVTDLIKQYQLFIGYLEQLKPNLDPFTSKHAWSVYLIHAQSVDSSLRLCFNGKDLFGDGVSPPVRVHLEKEGVVTSIDLPDPALTSKISIRSFLAGVADHRLPSLALCNACLVELMDALVIIQKGREHICKLHKKIRNRKPSHLFQHSNALKQREIVTNPFRLTNKIHEILVSMLRPFKHAH